MSLSNNDHNYRGVAGENLLENSPVTINSQGKFVHANGTNAIGICPQAIAAGARAPAIRGGTLSGLSGRVAGDKLRDQGDGTLGTAGTNPVLAVVKAEDSSTALILSGNLDNIT